MTSIPNPHLERAITIINTYIPKSILENWRMIGTTGVMVGLCLCPLVAWACESEDSSGTSKQIEMEEQEAEDLRDI